MCSDRQEDRLAAMLDHGPRVLAVFAHPDDETYLAGLLMHRALRSGGQVTLVCATRGELGGGPDDDPVVVGHRRTRELDRALAVIGVDDLRWLGLHDGSCADVSLPGLAAHLTEVIDEVRPDLVVTFGPDGITDHVDHRVVGAATTRAWLDHPRGELLHATVTASFAARYAPLHHRIGLAPDWHRAFVPDTEVVLRLTPTPTERRRKRRMLEAHASQVAPLHRLVGEALYHWMAEETFRRPTADELHALRTDPVWSAPDTTGDRDAVGRALLSWRGVADGAVPAGAVVADRHVAHGAEVPTRQLVA